MKFLLNNNILLKEKVFIKRKFYLLNKISTKSKFGYIVNKYTCIKIKKLNFNDLNKKSMRILDIMKKKPDIFIFNENKKPLS